MLRLNPSVAVDVGFLALDEVGEPLPGVRLDVQRECISHHPLLAWGCVNPAVILHDCGPNGVRLYADSWASVEACAPPTGSIWDVFVEVAEGE